MSVLRIAALSVLLSAGSLSAQAENVRAPVQSILDAGLQANRRGLDAARKAWTRARSQAPRDARVDYAWGLVLRKHSRTTEAERRFLGATRKTGPAYLPAHQALISLRFARGKNTDGLKRLGVLVRIVSDKKAPGVDTSARTAAAEWVGRSIAALEIVKLSRRDKTGMHKVAATAERLFTGPLTVAYDKGRKDVRQLHRDLDLQALKTRILGRRKESDRQAKKSKKIAGEQSKIGVSRNTLKKTTEDWKEWFDDRTKETERKLERTMKDLAILEDRRRSISRSFNLAQNEWNRLRIATQLTQRAQANSGRRPGPIVNNNQGAAGRLEQQMTGYHNRYMATLRQMRLLRRSGAGLLVQQRRNVKHYEKATGSIVRSNSALSRIEKRLKQQERKLKAVKLGKPKTSKALQRRIERFSTYVSFDVEQERQTLLKTYAK